MAASWTSPLPWLYGSNTNGNQPELGNAGQSMQPALRNRKDAMTSQVMTNAITMFLPMIMLLLNTMTAAMVLLMTMANLMPLATMA